MTRTPKDKAVDDAFARSSSYITTLDGEQVEVIGSARQTIRFTQTLGTQIDVIKKALPLPKDITGVKAKDLLEMLPAIAQTLPETILALAAAVLDRDGEEVADTFSMNELFDMLVPFFQSQQKMIMTIVQAVNQAQGRQARTPPATPEAEA